MSSAPLSVSNPSVIDLTQIDESGTQEEAEDTGLSLLATISTSDTKFTVIVGTQYYSGEAHSGEYVNLIREPHNPYDRNAIKVNNMQNQQVGHLKREIAAVLSPLMRDSPQLQLDATIPSSGNQWTIPIQIEIYGPDPSEAARIQQIMAPYSIRKSTSRLTSNLVTPVVRTRIVHWEEQQKELDELFQKQAQDQLQNLPEVEMSPLLTQSLYNHQIQGIRWLYQCECGKQMVPFYKKVKEKGKDMWLCEITNASQMAQPEPVRGGILADDMGLGKTLQTIGLLLLHSPKGRDYVAGTRPSTSMTPITTLIVCPVSVISNWQEQLDKHVKPNTLRVEVYSGNYRKDVLNNLAQIDVLVVSYDTLRSDFCKDAKKGKENQLKRFKKQSIFNSQFHRLVLDEAHTIRNFKSQTFQACMALQSDLRLCLTGTPLTNKPDDIFSLFSFLRAQPLGDQNVFRRAVSQPIKDGDDNGLARMRVMMAHIALRRSKSTIGDVQLPGKTVELRLVKFPQDSKHRAIYECIFNSAKIAFKAVLQSGNDNELNHGSIFEVLTRLRQACCCGSLVPKERLEAAERVLQIAAEKGGHLSIEEGKRLVEKLKHIFEGEDSTAECAICMEEMEASAAVALRACGHVFCQSCISKVSSGLHASCPFCRQPFSSCDMIKYSAAVTASTELNKGDENSSLTQDADLGPSPKMSALLQVLEEMQPGEKAVIFSQFVQYLNRIQGFLEERSYTLARIDGKTSQQQRVKAMQEFNREDGGPEIMLCSLRAAGTGINLTRANNMVMMDTWWNSAVEQQAQDRVHRIGQVRPVRVVRLVVDDTVEARMVDLQEAKAAMGKGAFENLSAEEKRKARMADTKRLLELDE